MWRRPFSTVTAVQGEPLDPATLELTERAVDLAQRVGDARLESAALDELTALRLAYGELDGAAAAARRRLELLTPLADDVEMAWEYSDALHMAPMVYLAAGDLEAARRYAQQRSELPFFREAHHLALEWLLTTAAIAGDFDEAVELAERFRQGWVEAGRPPIGGIAFAPAAAAMVYGIRGDDEARLEWLDILSEMRRVLDTVSDKPGYSRVFNALVALHRGRVDVAFTSLADAPETLRHASGAHDGAWRPWYAALWAESGVLAALPDRRSRLDRARFIVRGNPIAVGDRRPGRGHRRRRHRQPAGCGRRPRRLGMPVPARPHPRLRRGLGEGRRRDDHGGNRRDAHGHLSQGFDRRSPSAHAGTKTATSFPRIVAARTHVPLCAHSRRIRSAR